MASPREEKESLSGLARSLLGLFDEAAETRTSPAVREPGAEETTADSTSRAGSHRSTELPEIEVTDPRRAARELDELVGMYLRVHPSSVGETTRRIRGLAQALVKQGRVEPVADVVVRLAVVGTGEDAPIGAIDLARELLTTSVAMRLADRLSAIRDESRRAVRTRALGALGGSMAEAAAEALIRSESRFARRALTDLLISIGDDAEEVLGDLVVDRRWYVVRNAVMVLGGIRSPWTVRLLLGPTRHGDARVRREAMRALGRVGGPEAGSGATRGLTDQDEGVREAAAIALGALRDARGVEPLLQLVRGGDTEAVMVAAVRALGAIGDPRAVDELEGRATAPVFSRASSEVRVAAYRALASVGTPRARAVVREGLRDRDPSVRQAVKESIRRWDTTGDGLGD